jgi:hypothetical protein
MAVAVNVLVTDWIWKSVFVVTGLFAFSSAHP